MHVFVTGGSGLTGPAIVTELLRHGHGVTALARSEASAEKLRGLGVAQVVRGSLDDLDLLARNAAQAEGVIHMAFGGDFADPDGMKRRDVAAIEALGKALVGSGKPLVSTSGTLVMEPGAPRLETDPPQTTGLAAFRIAGEEACLGFASRGVRATIVRLAPTVHGPGDFGFIPMYIATARRTGVAAYIDEGQNRWPALHRLDAASLFRLALEKAAAGTAWHGAGEEGVRFVDIARLVGEKLALPVRSITAHEAPAHFANPFFAAIFGRDAPVSSERTRRELGWTPQHPGLLEDMREGDYFAEEAASAFGPSH